MEKQPPVMIPAGTQNQATPQDTAAAPSTSSTVGSASSSCFSSFFMPLLSRSRIGHRCYIENRPEAITSARSSGWFLTIIHTATTMMEATVGSIRPMDRCFWGLRFPLPSS